MGGEIYDIINMVLSGVILGLLLSDRDQPKTPRPPRKFLTSNKVERAPIAITDEMAHEQELEERE